MSNMTWWFHVVGLISASLLLAGFVTGVVSVFLSWRINKLQAGEIAELKLKTAEQQQRAADAERALLEVQQRIKAHAFTEAEIDRMREGLAAIQDKVPVEIVTPEARFSETEKAELYGQQLAKVFREAGWDVSEIRGKVPKQGLRLMGFAPVNPHSNPLIPVLSAVQTALYVVGVNTQSFCEFDPDKYPDTHLQFAIGINPMTP